MTAGQLPADRVAVVTGAASGMGRAMARALAGAGARVAGVDIDGDGLVRLAAEPIFAGKFCERGGRCLECRRLPARRSADRRRIWHD